VIQNSLLVERRQRKRRGRRGAVKCKVFQWCGWQREERSGAEIWVFTNIIVTIFILTIKNS